MHLIQRNLYITIKRNSYQLQELRIGTDIDILKSNLNHNEHIANAKVNSCIHLKVVESIQGLTVERDKSSSQTHSAYSRGAIGCRGKVEQKLANGQMLNKLFVHIRCSRRKQEEAYVYICPTWRTKAQDIRANKLFWRK